MKILKWTARVSALILLGVTLPFYFGYGNPLPFINPDYTLWENVALTMIPIMFFGLIFGWLRPKIGGIIVILPIIIGFITGIMTGAHFSPNFLIPLIPGVLYIIDGSQKKISAN
jgi:thiamine transporter ThiT